MRRVRSQAVADLFGGDGVVWVDDGRPSMDVLRDALVRGLANLAASLNGDPARARRILVDAAPDEYRGVFDALLPKLSRGRPKGWRSSKTRLSDVRLLSAYAIFRSARPDVSEEKFARWFLETIEGKAAAPDAEYKRRAIIERLHRARHRRQSHRRS